MNAFAMIERCRERQLNQWVGREAGELLSIHYHVAGTDEYRFGSAKMALLDAGLFDAENPEHYWPNAGQPYLMKLVEDSLHIMQGPADTRPYEPQGLDADVRVIVVGEMTPRS